MYGPDSLEELEQLLIGHKVTKVADDQLTLDNGTKMTFRGFSECCVSYDLDELNDTDNIITSVMLRNDPAGDDYPLGAGLYQIFVFADNKLVNLATFSGSDGNGYYGSGYYIDVEVAE